MTNDEITVTVERSDQPSTSSEIERAREHYTSLAESMKKIRKCACYFGSITGRRAEFLLKDRPDGSFLFRDSRHSLSSLFSITYKTNGIVNHSRLGYFKGRFCLGSANALLQSEDMETFVEMVVEASRKGDNLNILEMPRSEDKRSHDVKLLYPFRRSQLMPSLKELCRITIRHAVNSDDDIPHLPIPFDIQTYILDCRYLHIFCPYISPYQIVL